jgi:hypothetical protein
VTISRLPDGADPRHEGVSSVNLESYKKEAKRLLRDLYVGGAAALSRVERTLVSRPGERFRLSDAQHLVAREQGYRSWPELKRAAELESGPEVRSETVLDTGREYAPGAPVRVWVVHRHGRISVTDAGVAMRLAGGPSAWREVATSVERDLDVNVSRHGVISLPVVPVGPSEPAIVQRIGRASQSFYQELLDLDT